jgi:hypothetical protein
MTKIKIFWKFKEDSGLKIFDFYGNFVENPIYWNADIYCISFTGDQSYTPYYIERTRRG